MITNGGPNSNNGHATYIQSGVESMFNFFNQTLTFSTDISLSTSTDPGSDKLAEARLQLTPAGGTYGENDEAIHVIMADDNSVQLMYKTDGSEHALVSRHTVSGAITHVALTLGAADYQLMVDYVGDGGTPYTATGSDPFIAGQWSNGASATLYAARVNSNTNGYMTTAVFDNFNVTAVPAPASLWMYLLGLGVLLAPPARRAYR